MGVKIDGVWKNRKAHRIAWEMEYGAISEDLVSDHLCRVRACVRPSHVEQVTNAVNVLRGDGPTAINASKTVCMYGHLNWRIRPVGTRDCRDCAQVRKRQRRRRNAEG